MKIRKFLVVALLIMVMILVSCSSTKDIKRISPNELQDLDENWNDTDFKLASQALVDSCLDGGWITKYMVDNKGQVPTVIVGNIRNLTSDHIETSILSKKIEVELINSGEVETVADIGFREDVRGEQVDQQYHASAETAAEIGQEYGADYILQGSIKLNLEREDKDSVRTYYIDAELIDIESAKKVWVGYYEIKKQIKRNKYSW